MIRPARAVVKEKAYAGEQGAYLWRVRIKNMAEGVARAMALEMTRRKVEMERIVSDETVQALLRAEAIVPGAGRESVRVLMEEARFALESAEVQEGGVVLTGTAWAQALYRLGDKSEVLALAASAPMSRAVEAEGVRPGMTCLAQAEMEHVEANYERGHMVFQISVNVRVRVLALEETEVVDGCAACEGVETRAEVVSSRKVSAESGAAVTLEGSARMPEALDARTVLMDWCSARVDGAAADLGGVRVTGAVLAEALVGSGVPDRPVALVKITLPLDQFVEMPEWLAGDVEAAVTVRRLDSQLRQGEDGATALYVRAECDVRVLSYGSDAFSALTDAYGTGEKDVRCEYRELLYCPALETVRCAETVRAELPLEEGAPSAGTVVAVRARAQIGEIEPEGQGSSVRGVIEAKALYLASGSGEPNAVRGEVPFTVYCPVPLTLEDFLRVEVESADAAAVMNDRLEVQCALRLSGTHRSEEGLRVVAETAEIPAEKQPFGVVAYWPDEGESLWEIGRRYRVPESRLRELCGGDAPKPGEALIVRG